MRLKTVWLLFSISCALNIPTLPVLAQNSQCPPNSDTILVYRKAHGDGKVHPIPFEDGTYNGESNYITGVLEYEMGTSTETGNWWHDEVIKGMAVVVRTVAYDWCGMKTTDQGQVFYGVDDFSQQHYNPGQAPTRSDDYAKLVRATNGEYMTYNEIHAATS